jgi:hypothetical protein
MSAWLEKTNKFKFETLLTSQREVQLEVGRSHGGHNDERTLRGLVERVERGHFVGDVPGFLLPLVGEDLEFALEVFGQLWGLEVRNVVAALLLLLRSERAQVLSVG